jgi:hypothetical protein
VRSWAPVLPLKWEWDSHPINIYFMVIKRCIVSTGRLVPSINLVVWGHGPGPIPLKWVIFPLHRYIFAWWSSKDELLPLASLVPWVNLVVWGHGPWVLPLKWVAFPPYEYIFDGHQKMYCFYLSVLSPGSTLWCGVMSGSYLWNEWHSHPTINIYSMVIKRCIASMGRLVPWVLPISMGCLVPWVNVVVCYHGPLGPTSLKWVRFPSYKYIFDGHQKIYHFHWSDLSPGSTLWCGVIAPWALPLKWVRFPPFDGHQKMYRFHWSSSPLGQPRGVESWSPGSYLWNEWDSHSIIYIYLMLIKRLIVSTGRLSPLGQPCGVGSWPLGATSEMSDIPTLYKYIFDGH